MHPKFEVIEKFFSRIGVRQRQTIAAIHPVKPGLHGSTFEFRQQELMMSEISFRQKNGYGVYYSLNEGVPVHRQRGSNGKLLANEIIKVHMMGFDVDWIAGNQEDRAEFVQFAMRRINDTLLTITPNVIVSSGGGIQLLYVLTAPLNVAMSNVKIPSAEQAISDRAAISIRDDVSRLYSDLVILISKALEPLIDSECCKVDKLSNIDRVFRLPGTINFPSPVKISQGATTRMAEIIYDDNGTIDFYDLRSFVPEVTKPVVREAPKPFVERENMKWSAYNKAKFLCEYIRDHQLVNDNQNYTSDLMFPLFGMINRSEITAEQGRELWLLATSTGRDTAYGDWKKKWDTRKIANYTSRDLGSLIHFCRSHDCLLPWSSADYEIKAAQEAREITEYSLSHPIIADESDLFGGII